LLLPLAQPGQGLIGRQHRGNHDCAGLRVTDDQATFAAAWIDGGEGASALA
jgi:hypothetical protein